MDPSDILENAVDAEEYALGRLQYWLNYEKYSWILGTGVVWFPYGLIWMAVVILAVLFTPYMLWHLYQAGWYKSIGVFLTVVVLPLIASLVINSWSTVFYYFLSVFPLLAFYIFTWWLSYMIDERLRETQTLRRWKKESRLD